MIDALKKGFEKIIQYHVDKGELHRRAEGKVRQFVDYLLGQTPNTKKRLAEIIEKYNYDTVQSRRETRIWPALELWRGVDDFDSVLGLSYDGDTDFQTEETLVVIARYANFVVPSIAERIRASKERKAVKIDLKKYPISRLGYYKYKFSETALFYAWLGYLWQAVDGYKCGLKVRTVQNNSVAMYSLNDFLTGDFSAFLKSDIGAKPTRLERFFPRQLSLVELYLRASQTGYPFNPFQNYWRYYERGDEFMEIVTYEFTISIRSGKKAAQQAATVQTIATYDNSRAALAHLTQFTNQQIEDGWEELFRPIGLPEKMHPYAFDYDLWTGINWTPEQTNSIPTERVQQIETQFNIQLPKSFFHYLRLLNGRQYNNYHRHFPVDDLYTVQVRKFYHINELEEVAKVSLPRAPHHLWIGELENDNLLGIVIDQQSAKYGHIVLVNDSIRKLCDYSFELFARYAQAQPVPAEIFAAEENDVAFLQQRIREGWDYNTKYQYQTALKQAAVHNSHEALELLLEAGARFEANKRPNLSSYSDEKTMAILDRYDGGSLELALE